MNSTLWTLAGPIKRYMAVSVLLGLLVTAAYIGQGLFSALILSAVFRTHDYAEAGYYVAALAGVVLVRGLLLWLSELAAQTTASVTKENLRERLIKKLLDLGPSFVNAQKSGEIQTTIVSGVEAVETYYSRYMPTVFTAIFGCLAVLGALASVDWRSALVLAPFVALAPIISDVWRRWRRNASRGLFAVRADFGAYLLDSLQGLVTLKAFAAIGPRRVTLVHKAQELRQEAMRTLSISLMRGGVTGLLTLGGVAFLLSMNAWRVASGELAPVVLFMSLFLAREAFRPIDRVEKEFHAAYAGATAAPSILKLLAAEPSIHEPAAPAAPPARAEISFENVTFSYGGDEAALKSVSFTIGEHQRIALVGPSGAGKSTIAALLLRFFDPQQGAIRIGGVDIRDMSLDALRAQMAVVSQDTYLFHGTIGDNLRIAKPNATDAEINAAADAAQIGEFIRGLPLGFATEVGERGAQLSGGQRQRLAIARALLKNAPLLILDEATSNIDPASELALQKALDHLLKRRTTIVIAHRLSTIREADRILVLNNGAVVERGTHDELVAQHGLYTRLTVAQGVAA
jgi:ATP-binding cassette, subfamily C, bacterial CydD